MKKTSVTSRFLAGFEPLVLPPRGPDGMIPAGPQGPAPAVMCKSLCEAGPCRHYHKLTTVMEAQEPIGESGPIRRLITHACYPSPGVELELNESPVLQCSRWEPDGEQARLAEVRRIYLRTPVGAAFADGVEAFEASMDLAARAAASMHPVSIAAKSADDAASDRLARGSYKVTP